MKKAASYHTLNNPRMTNSHFDWDNKEDFSLEEIGQIALAGVLFDIKCNVVTCITAFFEPVTIVFALIIMFGNANPRKIF